MGDQRVSFFRLGVLNTRNLAGMSLFMTSLLFGLLEFLLVVLRIYLSSKPHTCPPAHHARYYWFKRLTCTEAASNWSPFNFTVAPFLGIMLGKHPRRSLFQTKKTQTLNKWSLALPNAWLASRGVFNRCLGGAKAIHTCKPKFLSHHAMQRQHSPFFAMPFINDSPQLIEKGFLAHSFWGFGSAKVKVQRATTCITKPGHIDWVCLLICPNLFTRPIHRCSCLIHRGLSLATVTVAG